ncbi:DUF2487 family protein [Paenibacillus humicola]|uniref:DUF2487 family protein n=1 Tax=Paenibacillus humicola TaxID=3110540 RepID=UPI00237B2493|nr:DUF2487 family protein [Paenibacillus humicola]
MKFSEFSGEQWAELQPYLDTALLPVTGLTGTEMPHEAAEALGRLRDVLALIEEPFTGRVVTYPAIQYGQWNADTQRTVSAVCANLRAAGFRYVIVAAAFPVQDEPPALADLLFGMDEQGHLPDPGTVSAAVRELWLGRA